MNLIYYRIPVLSTGKMKKKYCPGPGGTAHVVLDGKVDESKGTEKAG